MPEERLRHEPVKLSIRGFESRRALQNVSPVDWFCPSGRKRTVHEIVCENVFILTFVIIRQSEKCFGTSRRAMQKQALPENDPKQCQKISFRTVQEALKFSTAAFA